MSQQQNQAFEAQLNVLSSQMDQISNQISVMRQKLHGIGTPIPPQPPFPGNGFQPFPGFQCPPQPNPFPYHNPMGQWVNKNPFADKNEDCGFGPSVLWTRKDFNTPFLEYKDSKFFVGSAIQTEILEVETTLKKLMLILNPETVFVGLPVLSIENGSVVNKSRIETLDDSVFNVQTIELFKHIVKVLRDYGVANPIPQRPPETVSENQRYDNLVSAESSLDLSRLVIEVQRFTADRRVLDALSIPDSNRSLSSVQSILNWAVKRISFCITVYNHLVLSWVQNQTKDVVFAMEALQAMVSASTVGPKVPSTD